MVTELRPYEVYEFRWGSAVKHAKGEWEFAFLRPNGQQIDVRGLNVEISEEGIFFLGGRDNE